MRTPLDVGSLVAILREELPRAHPAFRLADVTFQSTLVDNNPVRDRALALLSAFFSVVSIALVIVGLYGVLSYSAVQRTREIGIRLALGAQPARVARLVLSEVGAAGATLAVRFIAALLFAVKPSDMWSVIAPLICLLVACALSALVPALRPTRIHPTIALRRE